ncbi:MAG: AMP-binding protein, partial [Eubacterium sp.]
METLVESANTPCESIAIAPDVLLKSQDDAVVADADEIARLDRFNDTDVPYDHTKTVVDLFREQAAKTPDALCVVYKDARYTYAQVDALSDKLAMAIAAKGLGTEDAVSILIPRCEYMAIASLGVLKAGCAYQPLDPDYPEDRLAFMMSDAKARLLIADSSLLQKVPEYTGEILLTSDIPDLPEGTTLPAGPKPEDLYILLYTSGSTGTPKGCMLLQKNLVNFCHWYQRYFSLTETDRVAAYASYGFDASMMDIWPTLTRGAALYIIPEEIRLDLLALNEYFVDNQITNAFM